METQLTREAALQMPRAIMPPEHAPHSRATVSRGSPPNDTHVELIAARATRLLEFTTALSELTTVERVAEAVLAKGLSVVEATRGFLARTAGPRLFMIAARGYSAEMHARVMEVNETSAVPLAEAVRTGRAIWLESVEEYRERYGWAFGQFGAVSDTQAHVSVPLIHAGETVGALGISFARPTAFGAADRAFTLLLAQAAAAALFRARSYDEESERRQRAELMAAARADVLGIVAHDLRNPLNLIGMTAQFILDDDPPVERRREMLRITRRAVAQMNRLVEDLLDAVRLQSGGLTLSLTDVDVRQVLRQVDEAHRPLAEKRGIRFEVRAPEGAVFAHADQERVSQALGNLIGNAIKFTPPGGSVAIEVVAGTTELTFAVADTGPGIPGDALEHLFDRFWQARRGDRRGVGLGLAIVKGIVEGHGGRISVESTVGKGSTFAFTLSRTPHD
jgi:signal transduction histidine kinase